MWPAQIRDRAEDLMLRIIISIFATYLSALVFVSWRETADKNNAVIPA